MAAFVRDKYFYRQLIAISVPIALQNLISFGLNLMDTLMLGSLGDKQISASANANQPYFIFTVFLFGLASGACVLTAQYWGKGDSSAISRIMTLAIRAAVLCSLLFGLVVLIFPEFIMSLFTPDREVVVLGAQYLRIIGFSYILSAVSTTYLYILRSVESVKIPLAINFTSFVINTALNWILIYGRFGFPAMGIRGSATATLCARIAELILAIIYANYNKKLSLKISDFFKVDKLLLSDFLHYSGPVVINETVWAIGSSIQTSIVSHIGTEVNVANSISGIIQRLAIVAIFGVANFTAVAVGKQIGAGNAKKAKEYAFTMLRISVLVGAFGSCFILFMRTPFLSIFPTITPVERTYANQIMAVYALSVLFISFNYTNIIGVLRGGGDTRFAMAADLSTLWFISLPLGSIAGLLLKWPIPVVFLFLVSDEPAKMIVGILRLKSGKWLTNLTR